jgi:hypothetical protein
MMVTLFGFFFPAFTASTLQWGLSDVKPQASLTLPVNILGHHATNKSIRNRLLLVLKKCFSAV